MLIDQIYERLGGATGPDRGLSYELTSDNSYALLQTPNLWGRDPQKIDYLPAAKNLTDGIRALIASAKHTVDITTMLGGPKTVAPDQPPFPDGPFLAAIRDGLKDAAANGNELVVRILFGIQPLILVAGPRMDAWLKELQPPPNVPVYVAAMASEGLISFNHAKLVVVDGERGIAGGHNMWNLSYCDVAPVHDVSVLVSGPANNITQKFMNLQWNKMAKISRKDTRPESRLCIGGKVYRNALPLIERNLPPKKCGDARVLSVGRLGRGLLSAAHDAQASRIARIEAAERATKSIKLSQQMLGGGAIGPYDLDYIDALARAVARGVQLYVVISDANTRVGYHGYSIEETAKKLFDTVGKMSGKQGKELASLCSSNIHLAALRFNAKKPGDGDRYWWWKLANGDLQSPANHAKVYISDDELFYVGSDNCYSPDTAITSNPDGFQEFGHIISGTVEVKDFLDNYWNKLWEYSGPYAFSSWENFVRPTALNANAESQS
jgi:phosphatidylserine/phosphatidylglycerophosphate/cardiolipin synthase-like enzyme